RSEWLSFRASGRSEAGTFRRMSLFFVQLWCLTSFTWAGAMTWALTLASVSPAGSLVSFSDDLTWASFSFASTPRAFVFNLSVAVSACADTRNRPRPINAALVPNRNGRTGPPFVAIKGCCGRERSGHAQGHPRLRRHTTAHWT